MSPDEAVRLIGELYPAVYHRLHSRWEKGERRPTAETLAARPPAAAGSAAPRHSRRAQSAVSALIDRLERAGHVARFPDARDRRRPLVWMTDEGLALLDRKSTRLNSSHD